MLKMLSQQLFMNHPISRQFWCLPISRSSLTSIFSRFANQMNSHSCYLRCESWTDKYAAPINDVALPWKSVRSSGSLQESNQFSSFASRKLRPNEDSYPQLDCPRPRDANQHQSHRRWFSSLRLLSLILRVIVNSNEGAVWWQRPPWSSYPITNKKP